MAYITTTADLLAGVGEFAPIDLHTLLSLLPGEARDKGLGQGAMTPYHTSAWERVKRAFEAQRFDVDDVTSDEGQTKLKALSCHFIMAQLHSLNVGMKDDLHAQRAKYHNETAMHIQQGIWFAMPSGKMGMGGKTIELFRG